MHCYFGLSKAELLAKFNTTPFPIQDKKAFLKAANDIASQSQNLEGFQATIKQQSQGIVDQLRQQLDDLAHRVVARSEVGHLDSTNPSVLCLLREPSLKSLTDYFCPTTQTRQISPDTVCHRQQTTVLSSKPSRNRGKRRPASKVQCSGVQKKTTCDRATVSRGTRQSARLIQKNSLGSEQ
jgi:hypothetical protein